MAALAVDERVRGLPPPRPATPAFGAEFLSSYDIYRQAVRGAEDAMCPRPVKKEEAK